MQFLLAQMDTRLRIALQDVLLSPLPDGYRLPNSFNGLTLLACHFLPNIHSLILWQLPLVVPRNFSMPQGMSKARRRRRRRKAILRHCGRSRGWECRSHESRRWCVCVCVCVPCELVPSLKPVHLDVKRERAVTRPSIESHLSGL